MIRAAHLAACALTLAVSAVSTAYAQMPDPRQMSGQPLPVGDLAPGTVTARVIKGQLTNPVEGQTVELTGAGAPKTATTDKSGRATFTGLTPGARVKVSTTVGSERIDSQEFQVPAAGGVRLMLVASDGAAGAEAAPNAPAAPAAQGPAVPGTVSFGPETRFVIELGDDALNVFNMLQIVNATAQPVQTAPLVFDLPRGAVGVGLLDGSSQQAVAAGSKVSVTGPFAPGATVVQFAYSVPLGSETITLDQNLPAELPQVSLIVQKIGNLHVSSPQIAQQREMSADGGTYVVGQGRGLPAGSTFSLTLTGVPSRPVWPRNVAVALALVIIAAGIYGATRRTAADTTPSRKKLQGRREQLFADLAALEQARRGGAVDAESYAAQRETIVTDLEDLYRGIDREVA